MTRLFSQNIIVGSITKIRSVKSFAKKKDRKKEKDLKQSCVWVLYLLPDVEHDRNHFSKGFFVHVIVMPGVATLCQNYRIIFGFNNSKKITNLFFQISEILNFHHKCKMQYIENFVPTSLFSKKNVQIIYIRKDLNFAMYIFFAFLVLNGTFYALASKLNQIT